MKNLSPKAMELSIIFVNWNSWHHLQHGLKALFDNEAGVDYEVIVVDNASSVEGVEQIRANFSQVKLIASKTNLGFAGANNLGAACAQGRYFLFLNPDTAVLGNAIAAMLGAMRTIGGVGIVGCKLLNTDGSVQTSCIQRFPTILNQLLDSDFLRLRWKNWVMWGAAPLFREDPNPVEVEVVSGACLLIDRESFERAGGFSCEYFMYAEDVDLCHRIRNFGRKTYYTGSASVIHHGGGSSRERRGNAWVAVMQRQALLKFCQLTRGPAYAWMFRLAMACSAVLRLLLLVFALPFRNPASANAPSYSTIEKWFCVLTWSLGLEGRLSRLQRSA